MFFLGKRRGRKRWVAVICLYCFVSFGVYAHDLGVFPGEGSLPLEDGGGPGISSVNEAFIVKGIEVYADIGNLADSRAFAYDEGARQGLRRLLLNLSMQEARGKVLDLPLFDASSFVEKYIIVKQRMTSHSYKAILDISFDENKIRTFLNNLGIAYAYDYIKPTLIVPILYKNGKYEIWNRESWNRAWGNLPNNFGLLKINIVREDSLEDLQEIIPEVVMISSYKSFQNLLKRYKSEDLFIVFAEQYDNKLEVNVRFLSAKSDYSKFIPYRDLPEIEAIDSSQWSYNDVVIDIVQKLDATWKGKAALQDAVLYVSTARIKLHDKDVWPKIQRIFTKIPQISNYHVLRRMKDIIELELEYNVVPITLSTILVQNGIAVVRRGSGMYLELSEKDGGAMSL